MTDLIKVYLHLKKYSKLRNNAKNTLLTRVPNSISHHLLSTLMALNSCYPLLFLGHPEGWQHAKELTDKQMLR